MTSEIEISRKEKWLKNKTDIGNVAGDIIAFTRQKLKQIAPQIREVKEEKLWQEGGYASFKEFCEKCLSVTRQRIYQLLDEETVCKSLEINKPATSNLTPEQTPEPAKRTEKKAKAREIKPPPVVDIESTTEPTKGGDEPCAELPPNSKPTSSAGNAATAVQPDGAAVQTELDFTVQITAPDDDRRWFQSLTPIERGQAIARARQQP